MDIKKLLPAAGVIGGSAALQKGSETIADKIKGISSDRRKKILKKLHDMGYQKQDVGLSGDMAGIDPAKKIFDYGSEASDASLAHELGHARSSIPQALVEGSRTLTKGSPYLAGAGVAAHALTDDKAKKDRIRKATLGGTALAGLPYAAGELGASINAIKELDLQKGDLSNLAANTGTSLARALGPTALAGGYFLHDHLKERRKDNAEEFNDRR